MRRGKESSLRDLLGVLVDPSGSYAAVASFAAGSPGHDVLVVEGTICRGDSAEVEASPSLFTRFGTPAAEIAAAKLARQIEYDARRARRLDEAEGRRLKAEAKVRREHEAEVEKWRAARAKSLEAAGIRA